MKTLEWSRDDFDSLWNELQSRIKEYDYNDGREKLDSIEKYASWSGESCGIDLRYFDKKIAPYKKYFLKDEHLKRPLNDKEMEVLSDDDYDGYKTYIDSDHLDNICELLCLAADGLVQAKELINDYYNKLEKIRKYVEDDFSDNIEE